MFITLYSICVSCFKHFFNIEPIPITRPAPISKFAPPLITRTIESTLTMKHQEFTYDLMDYNSDSFKSLKKEIEDALNIAFCTDMPPYGKCKVTVKNFENISSENMRSIFQNLIWFTETILGIVVNYEIHVTILECHLPILHDSLTMEVITMEKYPDLEMGEYGK